MIYYNILSVTILYLSILVCPSNFLRFALKNVVILVKSEPPTEIEKELHNDQHYYQE